MTFISIPSLFAAIGCAASLPFFLLPLFEFRRKYRGSMTEFFERYSECESNENTGFYSGASHAAGFLACCIMITYASPSVSANVELSYFLSPAFFLEWFYMYMFLLYAHDKQKEYMVIQFLATFIVYLITMFIPVITITQFVTNMDPFIRREAWWLIGVGVLYIISIGFFLLKRPSEFYTRMFYFFGQVSLVVYGVLVSDIFIILSHSIVAFGCAMISFFQPNIDDNFSDVVKPVKSDDLGSNV